MTGQYAVMVLMLFVTSELVDSQTDNEECRLAEEGDLRLLNGSRPEEGRVELCYRGQWERVSSKTRFMFSSFTVKTVCRQLGYFNGDAGMFGKGNTLLIIYDVACGDGERRLVDCGVEINATLGAERDKNLTNDGGVICSDTRPPEKVIMSLTPSEIIISWSPPNTSDEQLLSYSVNCDTEREDIHLVSFISNEVLNTSFAYLVQEGVAYKCCVGALYDQLTSTACVESVLTINEPITSIATEMTTNPTVFNDSVGTVGGVLGFIIAVLLIAMIVCIAFFIAFIHKTKNKTTVDQEYSVPDGSSRYDNIQQGTMLSSQSSTLRSHHYDTIDSRPMDSGSNPYDRIQRPGENQVVIDATIEQRYEVAEDYREVHNNRQRAASQGVPLDELGYAELDH